VIVTGAESGMRCRQGKKARNRKHAASSLARKATREAVEIQEKEEKTG